MKSILKENQNNFRFKLGPEETAKTGTKYKKLYLLGNTYEINQKIKRSGRSIKDYLGKWSQQAKLPDGNWAIALTIFPDRTTGEFNIEKAKEQFKPYIDEINEFYKYTLDIDTLIDQLGEYVPTDEPETATAEQAKEIRRKLEDFKEKLLNISSSEELQRTMNLILDVKQVDDASYPFSTNNKIAIKTQRPDATIVGNKNNWREFYNRTIKPDAKPIFVNAPLKKGFSKDVETEYLEKIGKSKSELNSFEKAKLYALQGSRKKSSATTSFHWVANYDVKDTVQISGTEDVLTDKLEKAEKAKADLANRQLDTDTQTTKDIEIIKPVYDGLLAYANAQNITMTPTREVNAATTKLMASAILSQILSGKISGIASKASVAAKTPAARKQQAEVASWQFMDAFGVKYNLADVDMNVIFGAPQLDKTPEEQSMEQKRQINNVLMDISKAVNHLIDFVNVNIKDNAKLNEIENIIPQGKKVTPNDIANTLGIANMINEQILYERLRKRFNLL